MLPKPCAGLETIPPLPMLTPPACCGRACCGYGWAAAERAIRSTATEHTNVGPAGRSVCSRPDLPDVCRPRQRVPRRLVLEAQVPDGDGASGGARGGQVRAAGVHCHAVDLPLRALRMKHKLH